MPQPAPKWTWREVWHMIHIVTLRIQPYAALAQRLHLSTKCSRGVAGSAVGSSFPIFRAPLAQSARSAGGNFSNASASADFERPCWAKNGTISGTAKSPRSNILHSSPYLFCRVLSLQLFDGSPYLIGNLQNATQSVMKKIEHMCSGHVQAEGKCYIRNQ